MKTKIIHPKIDEISFLFNEPIYEASSSDTEVELIVSGATSDLSKEQLALYPNLKHIIHCCNGINTINMEFCKQHQIKIHNSPTANINATAEHTTALILTTLRKISQATRSMREGYWQRNKFLGKEINECTIGFIGFGRIARLVNDKLASFKPQKILAYDPFLNQEQMAEQATKVELTQLFKEADIISLHLPLLKETKNMISTNQLKMMKPDVNIINCSRGGIIDETALIKHLKDNPAASAALDVFENEPEVNPHLFEVPNIILTPHLGSMTKKAQEAMITEAKERFESFQKKQLENI